MNGPEIQNWPIRDASDSSGSQKLSSVWFYRVLLGLHETRTEPVGLTRAGLEEEPVLSEVLTGRNVGADDSARSAEEL